MADLRGALLVDNLPAHEYEWDAIDFVFESLRRRESSLICIPGNRTVRYVCGYLALFDYVQWAKEREDFLRRASFGLVTERAAAGGIFGGITVDRDFILAASAARQKHASARTFIDITDTKLGHIYWSHYLARRYKGREKIPRTILFNHLFPVVRILTPDYTPVPLGPRDYLGTRDYQAPSFYATDDPRVFANGRFHVDAVIVDADAWEGDVSLVEGIVAPLIFVFNDPGDPRLPAAVRFIQSRYLFDPARTRELERECPRCNASCCKPGEKERICNLIAGTEPIDQSVVNGATGTVFRELRKLLQPLRIPSTTAVVYATLQHFLTASRLLWHALVNMVVPLELYDDIIVRYFPMRSTVADLLVTLQQLMVTLHGEDQRIAGWAADVCSLFRKILKEFEERGAPKQHVVDDFLKQQYDVGDGCTVLVADRMQSRALAAHASRLFDVSEDELDNYGIRVRVVREEPVDARPNDLLVVTCPGERRVAKFCLSGEAPRICIVGFAWELVAFRNRSVRSAEVLTEGGAESVRGGWLTAFLNFAPGEPMIAIEEEEESDSEKLFRPSGNLLPVPSVLSPARDICSDDAEILRIWFGTAYVYLRRDARVSVLDHAAHEVREIQAADLRPGATVVLIDGAARYTLYSIVLELLRSTPELKRHVDNIALWQSEVYRCYRRGAWMSYAELHRRLRDAGSTVRSAQTVRMWILGEVMGPDDPQDIFRLGVLLGSEVLLERWQEIAKSLDEVRGVHREVALELNRAILRGDTTFRHEFLRLAGVGPADLHRAVEFREVTKVERAENSPANLVGLVLGVIRNDRICGEGEAV